MKRRDRQRLWLRCLDAAVTMYASRSQNPRPGDVTATTNKFYEQLLEATDGG